MANLLVIAPHALDEVLGCGGAMALHCDRGDRVEVLVLFGNGTGMDAKRRIAAPQAAAILGTAAPRFAGFAENQGDTLPLTELVGAVERAIAESSPEIIYVPHAGNLNIDHQIAFRATVTAARPAPGQSVRTIYSYEIVSSTDWAPPAAGAPFLPARFVDITAALDRKMQALELYGAEMRPAPHARSPEGVLALARVRGHSVGVPAVEAFVVVRQIVDKV